MAAAGGGVSTHLFVAAIDFGTTYSGYAFSSKADFQKEPLKINANVWHAGSRSLISHKAPTALLLNPDKSLNSFGYDAENNFSQLAEDGEHKDYYFFHRFKMVLHKNKDLRRDTRIKEEGGIKTLPAIEVFSLSIRYLKDHLMETIKNIVTGIQDNDIKFVLTVPAIWDDKAKQFMREAAKKGGIRETQLAIALEPEAASIYCQYLSVERAGAGNESFLKMAKSGTNYMVLDLGGGTADITVHQRQRDGTLKELLPATGGAFGGKSVDDVFNNFLSEIVGGDNLKKLQTECMEDYLDLFREFETKKRAIFEDKPVEISITMPVSLTDIVKRDKTRRTMEKAVKSCPYGEHVSWGKQKLQISNAQFRALFNPTIRGIIKLLEGIYYDNTVLDVDNLLLVGGFAKCELVQNAIRAKFHQKRILVPDEAGLAVLMGAVLYGHVSTLRSSLIVYKYTYGCLNWPVFNKSDHPLDKLVVVNGDLRCKDGFYIIYEQGASVESGYEVSHEVQALGPNDGTLKVTIYRSTKRKPQFIDEEGCSAVGTLTVRLDSSTRGAVELKQTFAFQNNEIVFRVEDKTTGRLYETALPLV